MRTNSSTPKGMRDFSPSVMYRRNYILSIIQDTFDLFGFSPIETPSMENLDTLTGKYGEEGDRLIFKVLNSGDYLSKVDLKKEITSKLLTKEISDKALRYDLTVPFARYVAQNRNEIIFPFKRYQMQNVWRADRPQKGRFREFFQCDADFIGTDSLISEIELILICDNVFNNLNIPNVEISINNRKLLSGMIELMNANELFNDIVIILDKIDKIGIDKAKEEMLKIGISEESLLLLDKFIDVKDTTQLRDLISASAIGVEGAEQLDFVINNIENLGLKGSKLKFDITLARGIDYYTGCILEVKQNDINVGSIVGGGRYDDLTSFFGLNNMSGVGISFGIDRIYIVMQELNLFPEIIDNRIKVMFANLGKKESIFCLKLLKELRENGVNSEIYPNNSKLKKQMNYANKKGVKFVVIVGENEMNNNLIMVKEMSTGFQSSILFSEFVNKIKNNV
tara:strand:+ start:16752 stop:18107 length:1356 start_codon:yes stop_codon:yes gene_type:complete